MSFSSSISEVILETVVSGLARLFLAGAAGDIGLARQAAIAMLLAYNPHTKPELILAAETIAFSLQSLEALGQSTAADMPLNKVMRLRGSAVSLNREAHRSHQKLEQMQRSRWTEEAQQAAHAVSTAEAPAAEAPAAESTTAGMLMDDAIALGVTGAVMVAAGEARADVDAYVAVAGAVAASGAAADAPASRADAADAAAAVSSPTCASPDGAAPDREAILAPEAMISAAAMPPAPAIRAVVVEQAVNVTPPASSPAPTSQPAGQAHPTGPRPTDYRGQDCSQPHRRRLLAQQIVENGKRAALQAGVTGTGHEAFIAMR